MLDPIVAQPVPHRHNSFQRERARHTHPHQRGDTPRVLSDPNAYHTHYGTGTLLPACTAVRVCSRRGTVRTQLACASRRYPSAWLRYGQPLLTPDAVVLGLHRLHVQRRQIGQPTAMYRRPEGASRGIESRGSLPQKCHRGQAPVVARAPGGVMGPGLNNGAATTASVAIA